MISFSHINSVPCTRVIGPKWREQRAASERSRSGGENSKIQFMVLCACMCVLAGRTFPTQKQTPHQRSAHKYANEYDSIFRISVCKKRPISASAIFELLGRYAIVFGSQCDCVCVLLVCRDRMTTISYVHLEFGTEFLFFRGWLPVLASPGTFARVGLKISLISII